MKKIITKILFPSGINSKLDFFVGIENGTHKLSNSYSAIFLSIK